MPLLAPLLPAVAPKLIGQMIVSREIVVASGAPLRIIVFVGGGTR